MNFFSKILVIFSLFLYCLVFLFHILKIIYNYFEKQDDQTGSAEQEFLTQLVRALSKSDELDRLNFPQKLSVLVYSNELYTFSPRIAITIL